ncbi:MAG: hypothetical protein WCS17_05225 [Prevotella sp.]
MKTTQDRIYKIYTPLSVSVSLDFEGTQAKQSFKQDETGDAAYSPNRRLTPTTILPVVRTYDKDGIFRTGVVNDLLSSIQWYADDTEIVSGSDYSIDASNSVKKGMLTIYKNSPVNSSIRLKFRAKLLDNRRNELLDVVINDIFLSATPSSGDQYNIRVDVPTACYYNPLDGESSITVNARGWRGGKGLTNIDYELRKVAVSSGMVSDREITDSDYEIISASGSTFSFDIRMINEESYIVVGKVSGAEIGRTGFTIKRKYPAWSAKQTGSAEILPGQAEVAKLCIVESSNGIVKDPLLYFSMVAFTESLKNGIMNWGEREELRINPYVAGFSDGSYIGMYFDVNEIPALDVSIDEDGDILIDENSDRLLI